MYSKNYFLVFILTFFVAGFFFLVTPEISFSQGCCVDAGASTSCVPGQSFPQGDEQSCLNSESGRTWLPNDTCTPGFPGGPQCVPGLGCCIEAPGMCVDDQEEGQCSGEWVFDTACDTLEICQPVTGCCVNEGAGDTCMDDVEDINCNIQFVANAECPSPESTSCGAIVGCCSGIEAATTCENNFTASQCTSANGAFSEGLQCNIVDTCGQVGCCQEEGPMCSLTNMEDCSGTWVPDDTCTTEGPDTGICNSLIPPIISNVPTIGQWGMIAMAGLLGIFSLFIIMRRHRYNVS
ncbi:MAG: IPTL-CTERM sorting domain-containing protein [Candidatus Dadabacteria bacterium]|nr:IPTL-CTERM sorting domain-containing protein [Candidatus Dadabacteria bacterium]